MGEEIKEPNICLSLSLSLFNYYYFFLSKTLKSGQSVDLDLEKVSESRAGFLPHL